MPMNKYKCDECESEWSFIGPHKDRPCPKCQKEATPLLPVDIPAPAVFETVDAGRGVKWRDDFKAKAEVRNKFYNKKQAKERARIHGDTEEKHGITEDDAKMI